MVFTATAVAAITTHPISKCAELTEEKNKKPVKSGRRWHLYFNSKNSLSLRPWPKWGVWCVCARTEGSQV